jgi:hypothetical protein
MELNRLLRVVRDRWIFMLVLGVIGAASGWLLVVLNNQSIEPQFQAIAALRLEPEEGETIADLVDELETALQVASVAAEDLTFSQPGSSIQIDPSTGRLLFVALGDSLDQARERAQSLIQAYFDVDPSVGGAVEGLLTELEIAAVDLEAQLNALQPGLTLEELALAGDHDLVDLQIDAVRQRIVALTVANAAASAGERESNNAEMAELELALDQLEAEKQALPPRPLEELSVSEQLRANTIQRRLEILGLDYERLYLQQLGVTNRGRAEPIVSQNVTPPPGSAVANAAVGLIAGMAIAVLGLVFVTSTRKPVWLPEDVPIAVLGYIPGRKVTNAAGPPWYDTDRGGPRKAAIQALRTAVEGRFVTAPATLGVAGHQAGSNAVHALAADLAASFSTAGWSVLLVDADFEDPSDVTEYRVGGKDLASLLELKQLDPFLRKEIARGLDAAVYIREDLAVLPAGRPPASPADAVAGRQFRYLVEEASRRFDLVIVVGADITSPATQVQMQRVGSVLLALWPGRSRAPLLNALVQDLNERRIAIKGAVFLQRSERVVPSAPPLAPVPTSLSEGMSPINRLTSYPFPGGTATGVVRTSLTAQLVDRLEQEKASEPSADPDPDDDLGSNLLNALQANRPGIYDATSEYVVTRVEDMLTAYPGQGNLTEEVLDHVSTTGFMPLTLVNGHPRVGDHFRSEFESEVGDKIGGAIIDRIEEVLARGSGIEVPSLDRWLQEEFFKRHIERTKGEPVVWHLTSAKGSIQVLVAAQRLNQERLNLLETELVRRVIDQLQRDLKKAKSLGADAASGRIEDELEDAEQFGVTLGLLQGSSSQQGIVHPLRRANQTTAVWAPVWSEGIRSNLAPVQSLGLLPFPVLTKDELTSFLSTG